MRGHVGADASSRVNLRKRDTCHSLALLSATSRRPLFDAQKDEHPIDTYLQHLLSRYPPRIRRLWHSKRPPLLLLLHTFFGLAHVRVRCCHGHGHCFLVGHGAQRRPFPAGEITYISFYVRAPRLARHLPNGILFPLCTWDAAHEEGRKERGGGRGRGNRSGAAFVLSAVCQKDDVFL